MKLPAAISPSAAETLYRMQRLRILRAVFLVAAVGKRA